MSYTARVKEEIYLSRPSKSSHYRAFCYGLLLMGRKFGKSGVLMTTEHLTVSKLCGYAIKDSIGIKAAFTEGKNPRGTPLYTVELSFPNDCERLLRFLDIYDDEPNISLMEGEEFPMFLTGAFMACGTVNEPSKSYHLEFIPPNGEIADLLFEQLSLAGYPPKSMTRRGQTVLYFKESEQIEDVLTMMGATKCSLELMETKIYKDIRNRANRAANCDAANAGKMFKAASQQLDDIAFLRRNGLFETLPSQAAAIAQLREENPEASLSELAKISGLSRSGVNHRLGQITQTAAAGREKFGGESVE